MTDQLSAIGLGIAGLSTRLDNQAGTLGDLLSAFTAFNAGQARIIELLDMVNRQLATLNAAVAQEPDSENLGEMLRALLVQLGSLTASLTDLPHAVAAKVVLETDGVVLPPEC